MSSSTTLMSQPKTGRSVILEQFLADGMSYMFGNPGTVEQGFLDTLPDYPDLRYVLCLQETIAVMIGDGYARATQKPTLVQIHSTPGLGNSIGALYQAMRGHSPLVVIGGDAGVRYQAMDSQMAGDLVGMAKPVTKWSTMVLERSSLLRVLRRAVKIAATPPMGPVYVCLPMDILDQEVVEEVRAASLPSSRVIPDADLVQQVALALAGAERPVFFVGDGVAYSGAQQELTALAELLGAEVYDVDSGEVNMSYSHPLYRGATGHMFGHSSLRITRQGDVNFICGTYVLPEVFPSLGNIFAESSKVIHVDLNAYEIAKNHPVNIGIVADPKLTLRVVTDALGAILTDAQRATAKRRFNEIAQSKQAQRDLELERDKRERDRAPLRMARFMEELSQMVAGDVIIWDEALTNSGAVTRYFPPQRTGDYFVTRGGSLGVGIPGAIGAKLANPDKTVIGFTGDGGAMYTIQALWTAVRSNVDAKFVVCNNASYRILQDNITTYWKERDHPAHELPLSFDLSYPPLRFDRIAQSMGVGAVRVEAPAEIQPAIRQMLSHSGPFLIDLVLESNTRPDAVRDSASVPRSA